MFTVFALAVVVLAVVTLYLGVKTVPQGYEWTVERFGRYRTTLKPGLNLIVPFVDQVGKKINMKESVVDIPSQEVITKDNAMVQVDGVVFSQVLEAAKVAYQVNDVDRAIKNLTMTNIRTVMGSMDLDELLSHRDLINARLMNVVDMATSPWGIKVTRIEIKDIRPPENLVESMARQMKAERDKRALILEAEGLRQSEVLKAEGLKTATILEAEGRREAAYREAEAREREAMAEAKATSLMSAAIDKGGQTAGAAVNYFVSQKYVDALKAIGEAENQKVVMIPLESSGLVGAVAGVSELLNKTADGQVSK